MSGVYQLAIETSNGWEAVTKFDPRAAALADRHYSRRKVGSNQFMPPGQTLVLVTGDSLAVFGWWRPHPDSGIQSMNGYDGWTCTIFRNEGPKLSSELVLAAECMLAATGTDCGPDGMMTYVWDARIRSTNPGFCFKAAGWKTAGRSADGRKTLLRKPFDRGVVSPDISSALGFPQIASKRLEASSDGS